MRYIKVLLLLCLIEVVFLFSMGYSSGGSSGPLIPAQETVHYPADSDSAPLEHPYRIGTGIYDITGPPADVMFAGMVDVTQKGEGLYMRLRSRAFIIKDIRNDKNIVLVNAELGMMSQGLQLEVLKQLKDEFGDLYTERNVAISATHTHSGPGGYFTCWGLNTATGMGFCEENFHTIANGIVESIKRAHHNLSEGKLYLNAGLSSDMPGERYGRNRSLEAYLLNPQNEIEKYKTEDGDLDTTNRRMTVLKFVRDDGTETGMYNWAAVHPHVSGQYLKLINGDSKGYASYLFENNHGTDYLATDTFVAAFAMNDAGDSSANLPEDAYDYDDAWLDENGNYPGDGVHDYERMIMRAKTQFELAQNLYDNATTELAGSVDFRQMYVNFPGFKIASDYISPTEVRYHDPNFIDEDIENCRVCEPVGGLAMMSASMEDSVGIIKNEGHARDVTDNHDFLDFIENPIENGLFDLIFNLFMPRKILQEDRDCHLEKINALPMGRGEYLVPGGKAVIEILPIQIFKIGRLAIVALPFEVTTMAGRRIREDIKGILDDVTHVEISAVSDGYMGYLTTRDEYAIQHYEGGENWFGPYALNGVRQMVCDLASAFQTGIDLPDYSLTINEIRNTLANQKVKVGTVNFDRTPMGQEFGDVIQEPDTFYNKGETVQVKFQGGHPNNNFQTQSSYLVVEKRSETGWDAIAKDWDPSTFFRWEATGLGMSEITVEWAIPQEIEPGEFRISHFGHWKSAVTKAITPYFGVSNSFTLH